MALDLSEYEDDPGEDLSADPAMYWAAHEPYSAKAAAEVRERVREHYAALEEGGFLRLFRSTHSHFYGLDSSGSHTSSQVVEFGEDGEKLGVRSNQLRSLVRYVWNTAVSSKPAVKPRAINSTPEALAQIPTARRVLEYFDREADVVAAQKSAALRALLYGVGYLWQSWDPMSGPMAPGEPVGEDTREIGPDGQPVGEDTRQPGPGKPTGTLLCKAGSMLDVASDLDVEGEQHDWFAIRVRRNRYDLIAMHTNSEHPNAATLKEQILNADRDILDRALTEQLSFWNRKKRKDRADTIYEYHFMHRRTPAMPDGRYMIMIAGDVILFDGPLPYETLPVDVIKPEEFLEMGGVGYASAWDLLGMQDLYDAAMSICATNMDAFGHNDIMIPEGVEIGYEELRDGLNIIRYPMGDMNKPEMLEKFSIKDEFFKFKDWVKGDMELALGVNSVARGEPEKSLESGSALALVQAQAIEAQGPFVAAFQKLVATSGTNRIKILQRHLDPARTIAIAGSDDPDSIQAFSVGAIQFIDRIEVESVNPLFQTSAGKQNAADKLLERDMVPSAAAYMQFLETGRLETVTDDARRKDLFGRRVREILMKGPAVTQIPGEPDPLTGLPKPKDVIAECRYVITDDPQVCIAAASSVLDSFENRAKPEILNACVVYMNDVLSTWRGTDPNTLMLMKYPVPQVMGVPGAPMPGQEPKPTGKPQGEPKEKPADQRAPAEGSSMPSMPKPADNPL